jgi:hypothetical protein
LFCFVFSPFFSGSYVASPPGPGGVVAATTGSAASAVRAAFNAHVTLADTLQELAAEVAKLCGNGRSDWASAAAHNFALKEAFGYRLSQLEDTLRALRQETTVYRHYVEPIL